MQVDARVPRVRRRVTARAREIHAARRPAAAGNRSGYSAGEAASTVVAAPAEAFKGRCGRDGGAGAHGTDWKNCSTSQWIPLAAGRQSTCASPIKCHIFPSPFWRVAEPGVEGLCECRDGRICRSNGEDASTVGIGDQPDITRHKSVCNCLSRGISGSGQSVIFVCPVSYVTAADNVPAIRQAKAAPVYGVASR